MTGYYKISERYRVGITAIMGIVLIIPLLIPKVPYKALNAALFFIVYPFIAFYILVGLIPLTTTLAYICLVFCILTLLYALFSPRHVKVLLLAGAGFLLGFFVLFKLGLGALPHVETSTWGGFLVSMVVAVTGIVVSLPIGILLAMGRRSKLPIIRYVCVGFIEFVRGVPFITVLFFATYMLPFFIPRSWNPDGLLRVLIGVSIFGAAYLAEIIRGRLQAIPKGQFEGAQALGLSYPKMMGLIVLPQALKHVIPGIVNTFIGLFKDTTLVIVVSLLDLLGQLRATIAADPKWSTPSTYYTGFLVAGVIYFAFCFFMSRYSLFIERRYNTGHKK
jgi:general L-amino acid transport system permease protein